MLKAVFFDLDGTIIDTISGIAKALNETLLGLALPLSYDERKVKTFIGNGADALLHRALGEFDEPELFKKAKALYLPLYDSYQIPGSRPYEGMAETLDALLSRGINLYVYTNKPEKIAVDVVEYHYGARFSKIVGQIDGRDPKPNAMPLVDLMEGSSIGKAEAVYVGDSIVDLLTSEKAGLELLLAEYGYGDYGGEWVRKASFRARNAEEIAKILL